MRALIALCVLAGAHAYREPCSCAPNCLPSYPRSEVEVEGKFTNWLRGLFPERKHPPEEVLTGDAQANVVLTARSNISITFMWEGAGFRNELGYFLFDENDQILTPSGGASDGLNPVFPDVSFPRTGCLEIGDTVTIGPFDAGTRVGWYIRADGYRKSNPHIFYSFKDPSRNSDNLRHVALALDADTKKMLIGFEDIRGGGDRDYNDAMFVVDVQSATTPAFEEKDMPVVKDGQLIKCNRTVNITHTVEQDGWRYALLDNTDPTDTEDGCQRERIAMPEGWMTAPNDATHRAAISSYPWGAACVILSDGSAYMPATGESCGSGYLDNSISTCLGTRKCGRILITQSTSVDGNPNPSMASTDGQTVDGWANYGSKGYIVSRDTKSGTGRSLKVCNDYVRDATGNGGVLVLTDPDFLTRGGTISAWSKSEEVLPISGATQVEYSIFLDVFYTNGATDFGVSVGYRGRTHGFEFREVVWRPRAGLTASQIRVHLLLRGVAGCAYFSDVKITSRPPLNLLVNPSFAERRTLLSETDTKFWFHMDATQTTYAPEISASAIETVSCRGAPSGNCGAQQFIVFTPAEQAAQDWNTLFVYGCSSSTGVTQASGVPDFEYSVYLDIWYADNTKQYSRVVAFPTSTGSMECLSGTFSVKAGTAVSQINVAALYRKTESQTVSFDTFYVHPIKRSQSLNEAISYGDPHIWSWQSEQYDVMAVGEFVLFQDDQVSVQVRHAPVGAPGVVASVVSAFAVEYDTGRVQVERATGTSSMPILSINGGVIRVASGEQVSVLGNTTAGFSVIVSGSLNGQTAGGQQLTYTAVLPTEHKVVAVLRVSSFGVQFFSVQVSAPTKAGVIGLLGGMTPGSGTFGDVVSTGGRRLLQRSALDAVRVSDETSAFSYPKNKTTESYTDKSFDNKKTDLTVSFTSAQIASARATCTAASVSPETIDSCMLDVLALGDSDAARATSVAQTSAGKRSSSAITETSPAGEIRSTWAVAVLAAALSLGFVTSA